MEQWQDKLDELNDVYSETLGGKALMTAKYDGVWIDTPDAINKTAAYAFPIEIILVFVFFLLFTHNIWLSVMATLCSGANLAFVMMIIYTSKWGYGYIEATLAQAFIGFGAFHIAHLAARYQESPANDRKERTNYMIKKTIFLTFISGIIGILVTSTAIGNKTYYFDKAGKLFVSSCAYSIFLSGILFPTCCYLFGPKGNSGSIIPKNHK
jgi:hypothetical protein